MGAKEKSINQIEKQILDEFEEEIMELEKQGRLYQFETAMDHAVEKFNKVLKERTGPLGIHWGRFFFDTVTQVWLLRRKLDAEGR